MDISTSTRFLRKLEFENKSKEVKKEDNVLEEEPKETRNVAPEIKPVTASLADVMAIYNTVNRGDFVRVGIDMVPIADVRGFDEPLTSVVQEEPVNVNDDGLAELKAQGFTQADIDEYFNKTEDGKYELKPGIKLSYYATAQDRLKKNKTEVEITTIEQLKDFCGANKRLALLNEGWPEEMLDKYFEKTTDFINGKQTYMMKSEKISTALGIASIRPNYTITTDDNGNKIIKFTKDNSDVTITVKTDGSYTESVEGIKKEPSMNTVAKKELLDKGFTEKQISEWFTLEADGSYSLKNKMLATGDYANSYREFKSVEELAKYIGADSRVALRNQGVPDEIIDQFFELKRTGDDGSFSYELKIEGNYTVTEQGENKLIRIENKENDTITEILVKKDGTYTIETNEIITIGEKEEANAVAGSANELLAQGFTQSDIDKYFYKKDNQYFLRSDITFKRQGANGFEKINITTLEELKEYSGANSRKALQDQGLPEELIDRYYHKEIKNGKIVYISDDTSVGKDGNNTVLTWHGNWKSDDGSTPSREYTIKPDGSCTVIEYTSDQITDTTRTHYMLTKKGLSEQDIQKYFTEKDGLYTLKKGIMYKGQYISSVEDLVDALNKNK